MSYASADDSHWTEKAFDKVTDLMAWIDYLPKGWLRLLVFPIWLVTALPMLPVLVFVGSIWTLHELIFED